MRDPDPTNIKIIAIGNSAVATSPVVVVTDAIEYATNSTAANKDQTHIGDQIREGTDMSPTMDCMFVATDEKKITTFFTIQYS